MSEPQEVDGALRGYIAAREEEAAYWPRYRQTLALEPHERNFTRPGLSTSDSEVIHEWERLAQASADAYRLYLGVTASS